MSIRSALAKTALRATCLKWIFGSELRVRKLIYHSPAKKEALPPRSVMTRYRVDSYLMTGRPVYHIQPRDNLPVRHVFYLHGGAYVAPIVKLHWQFLSRLMNNLPCQLTVPLYGLAPRYTYRDAFIFLTTVYQNLLENNSPQHIIFMGDSSGGGLALAFAQALRDARLPQPGGIVMLSPWLDITASHPEMSVIEKRDPILAIRGAREAGTIWAGGSDPDIPQLSPINGSLKGLAPLCLLTGTDDILFTDARSLRDKAHAENHSLCYLEYPSMFHAWMLLGLLPESEQALRDIVDYVRKTSAT